MMIQIRAAKKSELEWVNQRYDEVEFVHSNWDKELIAIAEFNDQKAGLGRLVKLDSNNLELGGMYVFESFRGHGIAREIVEFLLQRVLPAQTVYCIPFEHLVSFYKQFGFIECTQLQQVPKELLKKHQWCQEKYTHPTALLILKSGEGA